MFYHRFCSFSAESLLQKQHRSRHLLNHSGWTPCCHHTLTRSRGSSGFSWSKGRAEAWRSSCEPVKLLTRLKETSLASIAHHLASHMVSNSSHTLRTPL